MPSTFLAAGFAKRRTHATQLRRKFATARHERSGNPAYFRAIGIEAYAALHHLYVGFAQTGHRAVIACRGTGITGIDTGAEFFVGHDGLHSTWRYA